MVAVSATLVLRNVVVFKVALSQLWRWESARKLGASLASPLLFSKGALAGTATCAVLAVHPATVSALHRLRTRVNDIVIGAYDVGISRH